MRCVIALFQHETNTFSTLETALESFASVVGLEVPPNGEEALAHYGDAEFAFSALVKHARAEGASISVPVAAYAEPGGKVTDHAFDTVCQAICDDVARGCDVVLLDLHGAMVTESHDDGEGELLSRIRAVDAEVPVGVALDFHTNLTEQMVSCATVIDGYRTYPHVDMFETGERVARTLFHCLNEGVTPQMVWDSRPMMTHMILQTPAKQPMKDIMDRAISTVDNGDLLNASVLGGFPLADIPHLSLSVVTVEYPGAGKAATIAAELCDLAWQRRAQFVFGPESVEDSVSRAGQAEKFPVVVADHGDNCGAGGSSDDMTVLNEMLHQGLDGIVAGPVWDPLAVKELVSAGEGASVTVDVGGKTEVPSIGQKGCSLNVSGRILKITDGRFPITGPMQTGLLVNLGTSVVIQSGGLTLLVCSERWEPYDLGCFTHAGIDPRQARYIVLKSRQHFRAGFEKLAADIILAAGPGVCSSDYSQFGFKNLRRPIYPVDDI